MTKEQVQALRDAGVSESAIIDRILQETADAVAPDPEPSEAPESPAAAPAAAPADRTDEILAAINKLTGAIQIRNQHGGRDEAASQSVDDILASVLTPVKKK